MRVPLLTFLVAMTCCVSWANQVEAKLQVPPSQNLTKDPCAVPSRKALTAVPQPLEMATDVQTLSHALKLKRFMVLSGACAKTVASYDAQQIILTSGLSFVVQVNGDLDVDPQRRKPERAKLGDVHLTHRAGYDLMMADPILYQAKRTSYLGLFKGRSDYVIARFDVAAGRASSDLEVLIRSKKPMISADFFPAVDTLTGQIGLVQQDGKGRVRLYAFDWDHGRPAPLH